MHWSIVIDLAIPVAERAAVAVEQLSEPMRHLGIGFSAVPTDRVRFIVASGTVEDEGGWELIDEVLTAVAGSTRRFTFRLAAPAWHPDEATARTLVAPATEGNEAVRALREAVAAGLGPDLCKTATRDEGAGEVVLLGMLAPADHYELRGLLPAAAADLGSTVAADLALVRWHETTGGPRWRVSKRYFFNG